MNFAVRTLRILHVNKKGIRLRGYPFAVRTRLEVQKELRQIRQKANVPGFRPGMVPAGLVKKMYGKGILADVINKTIGAKLGEYIEAEKLNVLGDPLPNEELTPSMDLDNQDTVVFAMCASSSSINPIPERGSVSRPSMKQCTNVRPSSPYSLAICKRKKR